MFLLLFILLTLVGGGIGHIAFFLPVWAHATRIHKPLAGWQKVIRPRARSALARVWAPALALALAAFAVALEISIFGIVAGLGRSKPCCGFAGRFPGPPGS